MTEYIRRFAAPLALSLALVAGVGACKTGDDDLASDTAALNRDLELANRDTSARPGLTDVPAGTATTPRPATPHPSTSGSSGSSARTSSGNTVTRNPSTGTSSGTSGGGTVGSIASGTTMNLRSGSEVCTNNKRVGDKFTATVEETVTGSNGATIPAGATALVTITELRKSENTNDPVTMGFSVSSVSFGGKTYPIQTEIVSAEVNKVRSTKRSSDAKKVAIGAAVGAIAGQVIGKDTKGTVIGAATGAAAGTAVAVATGDYEGCVRSGGMIRVRLTQAAQVRAE